MGANSRLNFFFYINLSFFKANMNLTVFAGILLAVTTVTARRASLVEKIMRAADRPGTGLAPRTQCCGPSGLVQKVEKIMRAADGPGTGLAPRTQCCGPSGLVQKIKKMMHAADTRDSNDHQD